MIFELSINKLRELFAHKAARDHPGQAGHDRPGKAFEEQKRRGEEVDAMEGSVPFFHEPVDTLRHGLPSAKADAQAAHPLQKKMISDNARERADKLGMLGNLYGTAFPIKMQIEEQMMARLVFPLLCPPSLLGLPNTLFFFTARSLTNEANPSVQRLPGLPSSNLCAEALSGKLDDFDFADALGQGKDESETALPDVHALLEARLGVSKAAPTRELP